jgi:hypothetical protein
MSTVLNCSWNKLQTEANNDRPTSKKKQGTYSSENVNFQEKFSQVWKTMMSKQCYVLILTETPKEIHINTDPEKTPFQLNNSFFLAETDLY